MGPPAERAALMRKLGALLEANAPRMAGLESRDNGRPLRETTLNLTAEAQWYYYFAGLTDKLDGRMMRLNPDLMAYTTPIPVGVVGAIVPWNAPTLVTTMKLAPALAAGCTMIVKVAEHTPVTTYELAKLIELAGFPKGVVNIVPGYGHIAGAHMAAHPDVDKLSFTGEHRTTQEIMRAGAGNLKRVSFECGGKSPHIVFDDADIEQTIMLCRTPASWRAARAARSAHASWCSARCTSAWSRRWVRARRNCAAEIRSIPRRTSARGPTRTSSTRPCATSTSARPKAPGWWPAGGV